MACLIRRQGNGLMAFWLTLLGDVVVIGHHKSIG